MNYKFLGQVNNSEELKKLNYSEIYDLCDEIRDMLISTVSKNGGYVVYMRKTHTPKGIKFSYEEAVEKAKEFFEKYFDAKCGTLKVQF